MQVTRAVLGYLAPLINARQPGLPDTLPRELDILNAALLATRPRQVNGHWESLGTAPLAAREDVDAAIDAALERPRPFRISLKSHRPTDSREGA